jgi:hypothetical protein
MYLNTRSGPCVDRIGSMTELRTDMSGSGAVAGVFGGTQNCRGEAPALAIRIYSIGAGFSW